MATFLPVFILYRYKSTQFFLLYIIYKNYFGTNLSFFSLILKIHAVLTVQVSFPKKMSHENFLYTSFRALARFLQA